MEFRQIVFMYRFYLCRFYVRWKLNLEFSVCSTSCLSLSLIKFCGRIWGEFLREFLAHLHASLPNGKTRKTLNLENLILGHWLAHYSLWCKRNLVLYQRKDYDTYYISFCTIFRNVGFEFPIAGLRFSHDFPFTIPLEWKPTDTIHIDLNEHPCYSFFKQWW